MNYRLKILLSGFILVLLILFSICLLYKLGYQDGWNDRTVLMEAKR